VRTAGSDRCAETRTTQGSRPATVLVVDDHASVRETLCKLLENTGYNVLRARNGKEAMLVAREAENIDVLITDLLMPDVDGLELMKMIRRTRPDIKILVISGGGHISAPLCLTFARQLGADIARAKPVKKETLLRDVSALVAGCRSR
jgi:two-component system, chemotaxis family, chemotaxis protein CheY